MKILPVDGPELLLAAVENTEEVTWILWERGVCAFYEAMGSILCYYPQEDKGYLLKGLSAASVFARSKELIIVAANGVFSWDGQKEIRSISIPHWRNMDVGEEAYCGWHDFRYHLVIEDHQVQLPMGASDVRLLPEKQGAFWQYWGSIFYWRRQGVCSLEVIPENHDKLIPLQDGWLAAIYERKIIAIHPQHSKKSWSDPNLLEAVPSERGRELRILLADGFLLEWNVAQWDEPVERAELYGEMFIAHQAVIIDDEIIWI